MANFTERAIKETFIQLLEERPLNKITVKDIVDTCGINRNTFYYHFADIPDLIEKITTENISQLIETDFEISTIENHFEEAISFVLKHKRAMYHIYNSVNRAIFEQYLIKISEFSSDSLVNRYIAESEISEEDRKVIVQFLKCLIFGTVINWLEDGMNYDIVDRFDRLCKLKNGSIEEVIKKSFEK